MAQTAPKTIPETTSDPLTEARRQTLLAERLREAGLLIAVPSPGDQQLQPFPPVPIEGMSVTDLLLRERG